MKRNLLEMDQSDSIWTKILHFLKEKTVQFLKWTLSNWKNFIILLLFILSLLFYLSYRSVENKYENIIHDKDDEITSYKNKADELYAQSQTYITDIRNLKQSNEELYDEVKKLKDNPIVVTRIKTETKIKEITVHDTVYKQNGNFFVDFSETNRWYGLSGKSEIYPDLLKGTTFIDSIYFNNSLTVDLIDKGKNLSIIVKSDNPYCQINTINGAVISPEKSKALRKRFNDKIYVVGGMGGSLISLDGKLRFVPGLQVTVGGKLFSF